MKPRNDFARARQILFLEGKPDRLPLWELYVDPQVQAAYLGHDIRGPEEEAEFWVTAGYDFVPVSAGLVRVGGVFSGEATQTAYHSYSVYTGEPQAMNWAAEGRGVITTQEEFEAFPWPTVEDLDLSHLSELAQFLPPEMKIIGVTGKIYTAVWMLMGYQTFAFALRENPDLVARLFDRVGELQLAVSQRAADLPEVGALWMSDDIAYSEGLLVHPDYLRKYLFPWYKELGAYLRARDKAFIYHSDGKLWEVLDDLLDCGFNALHPIEPKAMDIRELKAKVGGRLCLLGNIEVDRLARGTPEEIQEMVRANIRDVGYDGGYGIGSSNSVTYYVPLENYQAMLEAAFEQ